jgi:hypothetical protein
MIEERLIALFASGHLFLSRFVGPAMPGTFL